MGVNTAMAKGTPLQALAEFITKGSTPTTYGFDWQSDGVIFLRSECVSEKGLNLEQSMFISEAANQALKRSECRSGDLLITITGNVGRVVLLGKVGKLNINQHIARVRITNHGASSAYIYHFLSQATMREHYLSITTGQAYPQISLKQVRETYIPLPPLPEQKAIAAALSDTDELIAGLEALVTKKRAIKQGAMQQLLTGRKRLPGFTGEWEEKRLGDVGHFSKSKGLSKDDLAKGGLTLAIPYTSLYTDFEEIISRSEIIHSVNANSGVKIINDPCLLIAGSSNMLENIGTSCAFLGGIDIAIGGDIIIYNTLINVAFLSYLLRIELHRRNIVAISQGSTIRHVYASTFQNYSVIVPSLPEQQAVATVLSDMDAEIESLQTRLGKTRALKQGMMQELLTGRIRLLEPQQAQGETAG